MNTTDLAKRMVEQSTSVTLTCLVFVKEDKVSKQNWRIGLVDKFMMVRDGKVQLAVVSVFNKAEEIMQIRNTTQ